MEHCDNMKWAVLFSPFVASIMMVIQKFNNFACESYASFSIFANWAHSRGSAQFSCNMDLVTVGFL